MKIRVQQTEVAISMVRALGASHSDGLRRGFPGLQTGIVDGAENDFVSYYTSGHYEGRQVLLSLTSTWRPRAVLLMSKASWDKMTEAQQEAVRKARL